MSALEQPCATVQIELPCDILRQLFSSTTLCAADLHCLNKHSKQQVQQLLSDSLKTSTQAR